MRWLSESATAMREPLGEKTALIGWRNSPVMLPANPVPITKSTVPFV